VDIDVFFRQVYPSLFRYLHRLTGEEDTAADIAQESFVRLLNRKLTEDEARRWLFTVATNLVRDAGRRTTRHRRLLAISPPTPTAAPRADEQMERSEAVEAVRAALDRLPQRDRQMLMMREEGFRYDEIAAAVGVTASSVGTLLARALKRFKEAYSEQGTIDDPRN
jgi:RNA polymerase sigma factor (sigma-70 family)